MSETVNETMIEVRAPSEQSEGTRSQVQRWLKAVGEPVVENEPLIEVETDKVTIEIPAPASGVLREIRKQEGEDIAPGEVLAILAADHGGATEAGAGASAGEAKRESDSQASATGEAVGSREHATSAGPTTDRASANIRAAALAAHADLISAGRSSPAVRRLLAEHQIDASEIRGSGAGGRITVDDVLAHVAHRARGEAPGRRMESSAPAHSSSPTTAQTAAQTTAKVRRAPHTAMRKRIAERMVASLLHTAPHVTTVFEADMSAVLAHRARHRQDFESRGAPLTLTAYFIAACVDAILEVPEANSRWTDEALEIYETIDIGVGTALAGGGLVVPVVRNVQSLDLFGIAKSLGDLVARAREDRLTPEDVRGGTFTISNHGVSGSLIAAPIIINQPQSAILGVGKLEKRVVVVTEGGEDRLVIRPRCYVTLTIDHRVMDGQRANRFLEVLVKRLETWRDEQEE